MAEAGVKKAASGDSKEKVGPEKAAAASGDAQKAAAAPGDSQEKGAPQKDGLKRSESFKEKAATRQSTLDPDFLADLKDAAAATMALRKDLEFVLKIQMKTPSPDMGMALALLRRWETWFGPPRKDRPQSSREFGRELAVTWWSNPNVVVKMLQGDQATPLKKLLDNLKDHVALKPSITAAQLLPQVSRELKEQRLQSNAALIEQCDAESPSPVRRGFDHQDSQNSAHFGFDLDDLLGSDSGSDMFGETIKDGPSHKPQATSAFKKAPPRRPRSAPVKKVEPPQPSRSEVRAKSRPKAKPKSKLRAKAKGKPKDDSDVAAEHMDAEAARAAKIAARTEEELKKQAEKMPEEDLAAKRKKAQEEAAALEKAFMDDHKDAKKKEWEKAMADKRKAEEKAAKIATREARHERCRQQHKPEVVRLIARINYALHAGNAMRVINGVKVKDPDTLFNALDSDKSGFIGKEEFAEGLKKLKINVPDAHVDLMMEQLDNDMSGQLVKHELLKWWEQVEVVQAAAKAKEDTKMADTLNATQYSHLKSQRRIRCSASNVVAQLLFVFSGKTHKRRLYGKDVTDPRSFFRALDSDGSGSIHPCEIAAGLKRLDVPVTKGDTQALVDMIDMDGSGEMDINEILSWLDYQLIGASVAQQIRDMLAENRTLFGHVVTDAASFFEACDLDGSEYLQFDEICKGLKYMHMSVGYPEMDALLATMGKDRSSLIGKEEFCWCLDHDRQLSRIKF